MNKIKNVLLVCGVIIFGIGGMCFPISFAVSPGGYGNFFDTFANVGFFFKTGLILVGAGALISAISLLIPKE